MKLAMKILLVVVLIFCFEAVGFWAGRDNPRVNYYATFENGFAVKVDSIVAVPIWSEEQVSMIWPEYYAETKIKVEGNEIILRSRPFLFCDSPGTAGSYKDRNVYCLD